MSSSRLFLGELRSRRARLCFTGRAQNEIKWSCRSSVLQRTANRILTICLSQGGNPRVPLTSRLRAVSRQNNDLPLNQADRLFAPLYLFTCKTGLMLRMFRVLSAVLPQFFRSRRDLLLENLALRQQLAVLRARHPQPRFSASDRLFWVILRRLWLGWNQALILVQPETVVRWHRAGFKVYWTWISRHRSRAGRTCVSRELPEIIFRMVAENSTWGAPRIHGELKMLGLDISERTVLRWMRKAPRNPEPAKRWASFLTNHREAIAAMDFFTVPTLNFGI